MKVLRFYRLPSARSSQSITSDKYIHWRNDKPDGSNSSLKARMSLCGTDEAKRVAASWTKDSQKLDRAQYSIITFKAHSVGSSTE
mmetsp:Transcript_23228/g.53305  ORF Transcript_23228/g.53305 Transcript_23228/m.53305 type:complete len:85 (-) Transcript_23228:583-837(-)